MVSSAQVRLQTSQLPSGQHSHPFPLGVLQFQTLLTQPAFLRTVSKVLLAERALKDNDNETTEVISRNSITTVTTTILTSSEHTFHT